MKVLLASPNTDQARGNTVTVKRIAAGIEKLGVETEVISTTEETPTILPPADLVHGFHAYKFWQFVTRLRDKPDRFVVTMTGTDLNHDLFDPEKRGDVIDCLQAAKGVHVFNEEARAILLEELPALELKVAVIGQGATEFADGEPAARKEDGTFLFILPAGIRKVKNVPSAIKMLKELHETHRDVRLWLAGPVLEAEEGEVVHQLVNENSSWVRYFGQLPHEAMGPLYREADVLLNTSLSEGQPAAILEAMALGVPVIVSGNQGNRSIVIHGKTGFIYQKPSEFLDYAGQLLNNYKLRQQMGEAARLHIEQHHAAAAEAEALMALYQRAADQN